MDTYSDKYSNEKVLLCKNVENYLENIKSNNIFVLKSKSNIGPKKIGIELMNICLKFTKKVIVLEDDIVIKKFFFSILCATI